MKLYSWNVNGIRAVINKGDFNRFITEYDPDILCLQEIKAEQGQAPIDLPQYSEYWNSAEKKGYSGTAIFTKHEPEAVFLGLPEVIAKQYTLVDDYGDTTKEGRIITLEFRGFYLSTVYTPNAKDDLSRLPVRQHWDKAFLAYMQKLQATKPVIFCGDLNVAHTEIDLARPKENLGKKGFTKEERKGMDEMIASGFVDTFRLQEKAGGHYTWWSHFSQARLRNIGWRIDYVFASGALTPLIRRAGVHAEVMGSDHCPVSVEISFPEGVF